jgi:hypothetical protein
MWHAPFRLLLLTLRLPEETDGAPMAIQKLTKRAVDNMKAALREQVVWDEALPGFGVRIKPTGVQSYIVQYRDRASGMSRRITLGQHGPLLTFDRARKEARAVLTDAMRGRDPVKERRLLRRSPTVAELAVDYIQRHAIPNKREKSIRDDQSMLNKIILPALGSKKVSEVTRRDIEPIHLALRDRPYQANRVLALLSKMFTWLWLGIGDLTIQPRA